jgi:subtilisin
MAKQTKQNTLDLSGEFTGRYLMVLPQNQTTTESIKNISRSVGIKLPSSRDFGKRSPTSQETNDGMILHNLGIAIIDPKGDESIMRALSKSRGIGTSSGAIMEKERVVHTLESAEYLKGYKAAMKELKTKFGLDTLAVDMPSFDNETELMKMSTWGLVKTRTVIDKPFRQPYTGKRIKVCILDTGIDFKHQDFAKRTIISNSFVPNELVQDAHGHGTHCAGTAVGILKPTSKDIQRYSIAYEASLYVGKVLSNSGSGADGWILAGINWAISNKCEVISMSLGANTNNASYSQVYESAANTALDSGCLIVAAAGNSYPSSPAVNHPANCPSVMAVGAVDIKLTKASFSCIGKFPPSGKVDIAGPGVNILSAAANPHKGLSSIPATAKYGSINGTSMATPHVAGIAALYAQQRKTRRGNSLWQKLVATAMPLNQPVTHVGAGLVQAPYKKLKK